MVEGISSRRDTAVGTVDIAAGTKVSPLFLLGGLLLTGESTRLIIGAARRPCSIVSLGHTHL